MDDTGQNSNIKSQISNNGDQNQSNNTAGEEHTLVQFPKSGQSSQSQSTAPQPVQEEKVQPISAPQGGRESAPIPVKPVTEIMQPVEEAPEPELEPEIEAAGVQVVPTKPQIPQEEKNIIHEAKESVSMNKIVQQNTKLPMSPQKAKEVVKGPLIFQNASNPMLWLALLILRYDQIEKKKQKEKNKI